MKMCYGDGGIAVIRGFDEAHQTGVNFDGVTFAALQGWQTGLAKLSVGKRGASPLPPGVSGSRSALSDEFCQNKFVRFPEDLR